MVGYWFLNFEQFLISLVYMLFFYFISLDCRKVGLLLGWLVFALLVYKVSKIQLDYVEYDPFGELEIDRVS